MNFSSEKVKELFLYFIFGVMTTIINTITYSTMYGLFHWGNLLSNFIAWVLAVIFAFITNKRWVFKSKSFEQNVVIPELTAFLGCRVATGALDMMIMFLGVNICSFNAYFMKIISNVVVVVLNYVASKIFVFKK